MRTLYIEPFSGMAGDMFLAALIDLGDARFTLGDLRALAAQLVPGEARIEIETVWRQNLSGRCLTVHTSESEHAPHRGYRDIERLVRGSQLDRAVQERALAVFWRIALAEGKVHGCAPEEIHFHEVGAVDTIVDVCGAALALARLAVERVVSSPPVTGLGTVRCAHGIMPVPAPAVAELMRGLPHELDGPGGERLTPTGAALLAEFVTSFDAPGAFTAERVGYGAGHKDFKEGPPNILRAQLGVSRVHSATVGATAADGVSGVARAEAWLVEVNLDDMTGEELAGVADTLRSAGALDVWLVPVVMKKGRPGVVLCALCRAEQRVELELLILAHTTTLGLRWSPRERTECARRTVEVDIDGHTLRVKLRERAGATLTRLDVSPERDDLSSLAQQLARDVRELEARAIDTLLGTRAPGAR